VIQGIRDRSSHCKNALATDPVICLNGRGGRDLEMHDKDKYVIEQIIDQVNDLIENLATSASDALTRAEPAVLDRHSVSPASAEAIEQPAFDETIDIKPTEPTNKPPRNS